MSKKTALMWNIMFIGIILLIPLSYLFTKGKLNNENYENRELAQFPVLSLETFERFPQGISDYVDDHFPYKNQAVNANSYFEYKFLGTSENDGVIIGKDDWLFYKGEDGKAYLEYKRIKHYTDEELEILTSKIMSLKQKADSVGAKFIVMIVPNKETVYSEYMPKKVKVGDMQSSTDQLVDYLRNNTDLDIIWIKDDLINAKSEANFDGRIIYQKTDTHWNELGAYVGVKKLLDDLSIPAPELSEIEISDTEVSSTDLSNMIGITKQLKSKDSCYKVDSIQDDFTVLTEEIDGLLEYENTGKDDRRIMFLRDSFTLQMRRLIADEFNYCYLQHHNQFDESQIDEVRPDIFVLELGERRIDTLLN